MPQFNDFITTYRKDYARKKITTQKRWMHKSDYPDIISGPYTEYILQTNKTQEDHLDETAKECFVRMKKTYPKIERYLDEEIDEAKLESEHKNAGRTVYQVELCKNDYSFISKKTLDREIHPLPPDWGDIPLTIQRCSYRDYSKKLNFKNAPSLCKPPVNNLDPNQKERKILKITTGETDYSGHIGKVGKMIIDESLHGEIKDPSDCCNILQKIELDHAGEPYKLIPPYPVVYKL